MMTLLFSRVSFFDVTQHREQALKAEVNSLDSSTISAAPEQQLVHDLATKYKFEMAVLEEEKAYISHREVNVDVSQDPMRFIRDRSRPFYIKGTEITFSIPFKGDRGLFQAQPSRFNLNPPRGEIQGNEIRLAFTRTDNNADAVRAEYQRTVQEIKQHLAWLRESVSSFNAGVGGQVQSLVTQRKQRLAEAAGMVAAIGLPVKERDSRTAPETPLPTEVLSKSIGSPKKWDVFISHASEDKEELARPLAQALRSKGISVWYDEFSLKMGDSLRASIDYGLANSRYGVVILSKSFFAKRWPGQELNGLSTREVDGRNVILPIWHRVNFEDVRGFSLMLADRVASSSDLGVDKLVEDIIAILKEG